MAKGKSLNFGQRMKLLRDQRRKEILDKEFSLKFPPQVSLEARIAEVLVIPPQVPAELPTIKVVQQPKTVLEQTIERMRQQAERLP